MADIAYYKVLDFFLTFSQLSSGGMEVSTLGPLSSLYVVVPVLLGITLLHEHLTASKTLGLICAGAAVYLLGH
jgi:uncharacterized membrane protein